MVPYVAGTATQNTGVTAHAESLTQQLRVCEQRETLTAVTGVMNQNIYGSTAVVILAIPQTPTQQ
jgi:hypothetical protein